MNENIKSSQFISSLRISKVPDKEITEKINGSGSVIQCLSCNNLMFPKKIIFRTTKLDGIILYNYIGKDGIGCFYQKNQKFFCKDCFNKFFNVIDMLP